MVQSFPCKSIAFYFTSHLSLLTLIGIGHQYIDSHEYSWDNRNRKDNWCLIQYCVDGEGALEKDGIIYPIRQGDAFVIDIPGESHYFLPPILHIGKSFIWNLRKKPFT